MNRVCKVLLPAAVCSMGRLYTNAVLATLRGRGFERLNPAWRAATTTARSRFAMVAEFNQSLVDAVRHKWHIHPPRDEVLILGGLDVVALCCVFVCVWQDVTDFRAGVVPTTLQGCALTRETSLRDQATRFLMDSGMSKHCPGQRTPNVLACMLATQLSVMYMLLGEVNGFEVGRA